MITLPFPYTDPSHTDTYPLSLHDALPISGIFALPIAMRGKGPVAIGCAVYLGIAAIFAALKLSAAKIDRKSTRLNSSHSQSSYAVFCLKKKSLHHRRS